MRRVKRLAASASAAINTQGPSTSSSTTPPIPIILLKTPSTPTDAYETYFSTPSTLSPAPNFSPLFLPLLQHTLLAPALSHLHSLLTSPPPTTFTQKYGGIILTSQRAVEALGSVLSSNVQGLDRVRESELPLYTVGPATSRALEALQEKYLPRCRIEGQETGNGGKLAEYILQHYSRPPSTRNGTADAFPAESTAAEGHPAVEETQEGESPAANEQRLPLLFLVGETRRDIIPTTLSSASLPGTQRIHVDELVVYETQLRPDFTEKLSRTLCRCGGESDSGRGEAALKEDGGRGGGGGARETVAEGEQDSGSGDEEEEEEEDLKQMVGKGPIWIVVFSPAGCGELVKLLEAGQGKEGGEGNRVFVATIGPTTREVLLQEHGWEVDVCADTPSPEGLGEGIVRFMRERGIGMGENP